MDPKQTREYVERWKAVWQIEMEERKTATVQERWLQLNSIYRLAIGLGLNAKASDRQEEIVRQRWVDLKKKM